MWRRGNIFTEIGRSIILKDIYYFNILVFEMYTIQKSYFGYILPYSISRYVLCTAQRVILNTSSYIVSIVSKRYENKAFSPNTFSRIKELGCIRITEYQLENFSIWNRVYW